MRRRIVVVQVAVLAAALVMLVVPLAVAVRGLLVSRALDGLQGQVEQVGIFIDSRARTCGEVDVILSVAGQRGPAALALLSPDGTLLAAPTGHRPLVGAELERAATGATGRRASAGSLAVAVPLSTDVCLRALVLHAQQSDAATTTSVQRAWAGLAVVAVAVLVLAAGVGRLLAGRLARPLQDLATRAAALGDGDFAVRSPVSGLPEVDAIGDALDRTALRLGRAVDRGRSFAADASHQLRTPLTALRLHLESMDGSGEHVAGALAEADRLEATVAELVALTSLDTAEERIEASTLVSPPVEATRVAATPHARRVDLEVVPGLTLRTRPAAVRQALQVLLDNALLHGQGTIHVRVTPTLPDEPVAATTATAAATPGPGPRGIRIQVDDEGPGPPAEALEALRARDRGASLPLTGGRGLALARLLVEGEGGRLVAEEAGGRRVLVLVLPLEAGPGPGTSST